MNTPKFKEGEWIKRKEDGRTAQVLMLLNTCYNLRLADDDGWYLDYDSQDNWEITSNPNEESSSSETPADLEEAAKSHRSTANYGGDINLAMEDSYKKGAKWQKEQMMMETPVSEDLEEAAEISFDEARALTEGYLYFLAKGLKENHPRPIGPHWFCEYAKNRFIAGAKWQKEQMMKGAVDSGMTVGDINRKLWDVPEDYKVVFCKEGDKVHAIIVKEEGK